LNKDISKILMRIRSLLSSHFR